MHPGRTVRQRLSSVRVRVRVRVPVPVPVQVQVQVPVQAQEPEQVPWWLSLPHNRRPCPHLDTDRRTLRSCRRWNPLQSWLRTFHPSHNVPGPFRRTSMYRLQWRTASMSLTVQEPVPAQVREPVPAQVRAPVQKREPEQVPWLLSLSHNRRPCPRPDTDHRTLRSCRRWNRLRTCRRTCRSNHNAPSAFRKMSRCRLQPRSASSWYNWTSSSPAASSLRWRKCPVLQRLQSRRRKQQAAPLRMRTTAQTPINDGKINSTRWSPFRNEIY